MDSDLNSPVRQYIVAPAYELEIVVRLSFSRQHLI